MKSNLNCVSNVYSGLYDLNGNFEHWLDMCDVYSGDGSVDVCALTSPEYYGNPVVTHYECNVNGNANLRNGNSSMTTIRCCSDTQ